MIRFSKDKKEGKIWLYIPSILVLIWKGSLREKNLLTVLVLLLFISMPLFIDNIKTQRLSEGIRNEQLLASVAASPDFSDVNLEAKSAYIYDIENKKVLFSKNEDEVLPLASLTKIMTALVALENMSTDEVITIPREALGLTGDNGLFLNERWYLDDLIKFMLVSSSNDAAKAVSLSLEDQIGTDIFIEQMNRKAVELGLLNTKFLNESGLDISESEVGLPADLPDEASAQAGAYGTAREMAELFVYAVKKYPEIFKATGRENITLTSLSGFDHNLTNTNILTTSIYNIIASKTGLTTLAGGNLAVVFDADLGRPMVAVVLGSTEEGRFSDIEKIIMRTVR